VPNTAAEWGFWIFSTIVVGLIIGIGVNLLTPQFSERGMRWLQARRLKEEEHDKRLEEISHLLETNPMEVLLRYLSFLVGIGSGLMFFGFIILVIMLTLVLLGVMYGEIPKGLLYTMIFGLWLAGGIELFLIFRWFGIISSFVRAYILYHIRNPDKFFPGQQQKEKE
jgi:uncharacterized membrane protein